jgi:DNA primase
MHNSLKEKILESVDIVEVVGERVSLTRKGREFVGLCPFHDDHRPSLSVSPQKRIFKCWSCGAGGDVIKFVQLSQRVEFREALAMLGRRIGLDMRATPAGDRSEAIREKVRRTLNWAQSHFQRNLLDTAAGKRAADYARKRGLTDRTIERFGLGFAADSWDDLLSNATRTGIPLETLQQGGLVTTNEQGKTYDRFRNRLTFPIRDALGRTVAFGGRTLGDDPAKYLNSPETSLFSKSRILYGLDVARAAIASSREVIVVEGYTDVVLLSQAGISNVVATLGTALTDAHVKLLTPLCDRVVMCFDNDEAGLRAADRAVETALRHQTEVRVAVVPDGQDPADFVIGQGADAFKSLLQSAIDALEFRWNRTVESYNARGPRGQRDAADAFLRFVARAIQAGGMVDPLDFGPLVHRLSRLLALPAETVFELLAKGKAAAARESSSRTPDTSELSAYDVSIRGLPPGLVSAVEELFGLALTVPEYFVELGEELSAGARQCDPWRRLYEIIDSVAGKSRSYVKADVIRRCDESILCELVSRATARVASNTVDAHTCQAVCERVRSELAILQYGGLRGRLGESSKNEEDREQAYRSLLKVARGQHGLLGVDQRLTEPH